MAAATSLKKPGRLSSPLPLPLPCLSSAAICTPNWRNIPMVASPSSIRAMTTLGLCDSATASSMRAKRSGLQ